MPLRNHHLSDLALRYTRLFEAAQDGILILDYPEARIEDANPYICNLIGYSREELLGKQIWELGLISDKAKADVVQETLIKTGYIRYEDINLLTKNGIKIPVEFICNAYPIDGSTVIQCNIREISARKEAESALALEQAKLAKQMYDTIDSLSNVIEARDPYTAGHQMRVTHLAVAIAHEMKLSPFVIDGLRFAAQIHDIGKIGIPSEILTKPSALNPLEIAILRSHAQAGFDILKPLSFPWPVTEIIIQHHERLDGSGYPNNLKGDAIHLEARILAVADTVEAMTSDRPYRAAKGLEAALAEIQSQSGILYDSRVVDACVRLFREQGYQLPDIDSTEHHRL